MIEEYGHAVADEVGGRLVPGEQQQRQVAQQFGAGQGRVVRRRGGGELAGQVVGGAAPAVGDQADQVVA
jgi:hypothetical protein